MLTLLKENDPKLLEVSHTWDFEKDGDPSELIKELTRVLTENGGVGLAAPQCGISKTIFIMRTTNEMLSCINPKIISLSDETGTDIEGCLSFPNLWLKVKRPTKCTVQYQNVLGEIVQEEFNEYTARVYLHELDHLLGITFNQRVGDMSLKMAREKREKEYKSKARKQ